MKRRVNLIAVILAGFSVVPQARVHAEKEDIFFRTIPTVITAARREQPITEAPAAISVITSDDIKLSGAISIPDLLRTVPGLDVMAVTVRDQQVSSRGFNEPVSNKVLVLIDGRSVYWDTHGSVLWDSLPVLLEEIDRIEIVRSPSSSLYGANAFCGVINIITKSPANLDGTQLNITGGDHDTFIGSLLHGEKTDQIGYKISAEWDTTKEWRGTDGIAGRITKANALVEYEFTENSNLSFSGGDAHYEDRKVFGTEEAGNLDVDGDMYYFQLDLKHSDLKVRTFLKKEDVDITWLLINEKIPVFTRTYDTEIQYSLNNLNNHNLIIGANYRGNLIEKNANSLKDYTQDLWAVFMEDELKLSDTVSLALGGRYDRHPLVKEHFSPRCNITYAPVKDHIVRLSAGKAFRNPSFLFSYLYAARQVTTYVPANPPLWPEMEVPFTYITKGNQNLKSESIISYEVGYQSFWSRRFKSNLNLFYNKYSGFFTSSTDVIYYTAGELSPFIPSIPKEITVTYVNSGTAWGIGGEAGLDILVSDRLSGTVNYSYQRITDEEDSITTFTVNEKNRVRNESPAHKINAGLRIKLRRNLSANVFAHWRDKTKTLIKDMAGNETMYELDDYTIINMRLGCVLWQDTAEVSLNIFNIFNDIHYEYPPGGDIQNPASHKIGRKITAGLRYKF